LKSDTRRRRRKSWGSVGLVEEYLETSGKNEKGLDHFPES